MSIEKNNSRIFGLDIVRASAILLVLLCHYCLVFWQILFNQTTPVALQVAGLFGVQLFFALSGYLIGKILIEIVGRDVTPRTISIFWVRRWLRTLPCYYVAIALAAWVSNINGFHEYHIWQYLTLTQNLVGQHGQFMGVSWSLTIEEWFYLMFPLLLIAAASLTKRHAMLIALTVVIVFSAVGRPFAWQRFGYDWSGGLRVTVFLQLDSIAYGALAALLVHERTISRSMRLATAVLGVVVFSGCWLYLLYGGGGSFLFMSNGIFIGTAISGSLIAVGFGGIKKAPRLVSSPIEFLSNHSYTIYLVHMEMAAAVAHFRPQTGLPQWSEVIFAPLAGLAMAMLMTSLIERPIMKRRPKQFVGAGSQKGVTVPGPDLVTAPAA